MKIYDINGNIVINPDLELGYLKKDRIFVAHHEAVAAVEEQWHYETVAEYPNGGKDVQKVVDVPGVAARDAWDEYENIYRYVPYTSEELDASKKPGTEERLEAIEAAILEMMMGGTI